MDIADVAIGAAGLVVAILAFLVGRRALRPPPRELRVHIDGPIPLVPPRHAGSSLIEVRSNGQPMKSPHITTFNIQLAGTHDISTAMFEQGKPIKFNLGKVSDILESEPPTFLVCTAGDELLFGPGLVKVGQRVSASILTDGKPDAALPDVPIADVMCVDDQSRLMRESLMNDRIVYFSSAACILVLVLAGVFGFFVDPAGRDSGTLSSPWTIVMAASFLLPVAGFITVGMRGKRQAEEHRLMQH